MEEIKCSCGYEWIYNGQAIYASCPRCHYQNRTSKPRKINQEGKMPNTVSLITEEYSEKEKNNKRTNNIKLFGR